MEGEREQPPETEPHEQPEGNEPTDARNAEQIPDAAEIRGDGQKNDDPEDTAVDQDSDTRSDLQRRRDPLEGTAWTDAEVRRAMARFSEVLKNSDLDAMRRNAEAAQRLGEAMRASGLFDGVSASLAPAVDRVNRLINELANDPNSDLARQLSELGKVSRLAVRLDDPTRAALNEAAARMSANPALAEAFAAVAIHTNRTIETAGFRRALELLWKPKLDTSALRTMLARLEDQERQAVQGLSSRISAEEVSELALRSLGSASPETFAIAYERLVERRDEWGSYEDAAQAAREILHDVDPSLDLDATSDDAMAAQESLLQVLYSMDVGESDAESKKFSREVGGGVAVGTVGFFLVLMVINPAFLGTLLTLLSILGYGAYMFEKTTKVMDQ